MRNAYVHMGLDKSIFGFYNYHQVLKEVENFLNEHIPNKFYFCWPKLIHSSKWRFGYIIARK